MPSREFHKRNQAIDDVQITTYVAKSASLPRGSEMTPWQKVHKKFDMSAAALAAAIGRDRSKLSRALRDPIGAINSKDMQALMAAAKDRGVDLTLEDFQPDHAETV